MNFNQVVEFLNYKFFSKHKNGYGVHSPFVFDLIKNVFNGKVDISIYSPIESHRKDLLHSEGFILKKDFGALKKRKKGQEKVASIAKKSLKQKKYSQLLYRIVNFYNCKNILELGTSFGITTSYLKKGNQNSNLTTIEACENTSLIAKETFKKLKIKDINLVIDEFDNVLEKIINEFETIDFVFFDGNHQKEPTLKYFNTCYTKINPNSIFVFDDIYWSKDMESAWKNIIHDKRSIITIDLFTMGLVFFKENTEKQHFVIRF